MILKSIGKNSDYNGIALSCFFKGRKQVSQQEAPIATAMGVFHLAMLL